MGFRLVSILRPTCRLASLLTSVTHLYALLRSSIVKADIGPIRLSLGHVITPFFGMTQPAPSTPRADRNKSFEKSNHEWTRIDTNVRTIIDSQHYFFTCVNWCPFVVNSLTKKEFESLSNRWPRAGRTLHSQSRRRPWSSS